MNPYYHQARFLKSVNRLALAPLDDGLEVAFAGRSNSGKSSALNLLCNQKNLARISKLPGRTQLLNFFLLDDRRRLVDLPGYGYAKVAGEVKQRWQQTMIDYLSARRSLCGVILVMDIRHPMKDFDQQLLDWTAAKGLPTHVLLSKADKLTAGAARITLRQLQRQTESGLITFQLFSAPKRQGIDEAHRILDDWLRLADLAASVTNSR